MALIRPKNISTANLSDGSNFLQSLPAGTVVQGGAIPQLVTRNATHDSTDFTTVYTLNITPKYATSSIVFWTKWQVFFNGNANYAPLFRIYNSTNGYILNSNLGDPAGCNNHDPYTNQVTDSRMATGGGTRSDSPGSTSQQTYQYQFAKASADRGIINWSHNSGLNSNGVWFEIL